MALNLEGALVRVESDWFVAGFVLRGGKCVEAAPVLRHYGLIGKSVEKCRQLIRRQRWRACIIKPRTS